MKDIESMKVELKDEALDWVNGGYLTADAQEWVDDRRTPLPCSMLNMASSKKAMGVC